MEVKQIDFSKTLSEDQVYNCILQNYEALGTDWITHQWNWINGIYTSFQDHIKFLIIISLVEKTLNFYHQVNITQNYDQYYAKDNLQINKFSISELCEKLNLPKETLRRKVLELEKLGVIKRKKKQVEIDRSAYIYVKPQNQIPLTSKYLASVGELLNKEKIYDKKIDKDSLEKLIKKNFTLCWRWYYRMQIPLVIGYDKFMKDITTFHIWGTICMNQILNVSKHFEKGNDKLPLDHFTTNEMLIENFGANPGISAMSICEMTGIPRATIIRKCKYLVEEDLIKINEKKQYILSSLNFKKILPYQTEAFKFKAKFIRKILNLLVIS